MPDRHQLQETYTNFPDAKLLELAADFQSLTDEARLVLSEELQRRKLGAEDLAPILVQRAHDIERMNEPTSFGAKLLSRLAFGAAGPSLYQAFRDIATGKQNVDDVDSKKS